MYIKAAPLPLQIFLYSPMGVLGSNPPAEYVLITDWVWQKADSEIILQCQTWTPYIIEFLEAELLYESLCPDVCL